MKLPNHKYIAIGMLALGWAAAAEALDRKSMTGAVCSPLYGGQWSKLKISALGITNDSATADTYVACSLPNDGEFWVDGGALIIKLRFTGAGGTVSCTAYSGDDDNGYIAYPKVLTGAAGLSYALQWSGLSRPYVEAPVGFNCKLPPKVKIGRVSLYEPEDTDDAGL